MNATAVRNVKKGEFVKRKASARKVYIRGEYDRATRRYSLVDFEDHCREVFVPGNATVITGFTF